MLPLHAKETTDDPPSNYHIGTGWIRWLRPILESTGQTADVRFGVKTRKVQIEHNRSALNPFADMKADML
jgi:hypothetical protein